MARRQSNPKQPQGLPKGVSLRHRLRLGSTTYSVAVSSDGQRAGTGSEHGNVKVWDLESGRQVHSLEGHREDINSLVVSRDGPTGGLRLGGSTQSVFGTCRTVVRSGPSKSTQTMSLLSLLPERAGYWPRIH